MAKSLPGLWRAEKIQTKAARAGFEWPNAQAALDKLAEELAELQQAVAEDSNIEEELGDLLFAAVKVARFFHIDAEEALAGTCEKFIRRFSGVEAAVTAQGRTMHDLDVAQLMALWNREKHPEQREKRKQERGNTNEQNRTDPEHRRRDRLFPQGCGDRPERRHPPDHQSPGGGGEDPDRGLRRLRDQGRAERMGRNPKTGENIPIPATKIPAFKAGKALKDAVDQ